jgi:LysM domain
MRKLVLTLIGFAFSLSLFAESDRKGRPNDTTGDSLSYLTAKDTIFLKLDEFGNGIFSHQLAKGQTMYSLAKFYGIKLEVLYNFNTELPSDGSVGPGKSVNVVVPDSAIVDWKSAWPRKDFVPVFYTVKHGDTFYKVSKTYFGLQPDTLKARLYLKNTTLKTGQQLQVGWLSTKGIPEAMQAVNRNPLGLKMQALQQAFNGVKKVKKPQFQNGAAYWQREKKGGSDYFALHRTAPVGSVIQVTNPLRKKTVFAKVIAPIPDQAYGDDIIVVLSPSVAKLLGAKDPKFFVEIKYFEWVRE